MLVITVKSCGKAHAWCRECRPEISVKIGDIHRGLKHSKKTKAQMSATALGRKKSSETRKRMSEAQKIRPLPLQPCGNRHWWCEECRPDTVAKVRDNSTRHMDACQGSCNRVGCSRSPAMSPTNLERILYELLVDFPEVEMEKSFGRYRVDAYLPPPYHLAFEADGAYWHQDAERDETRDAYLLSNYDLPVVRLTETELLRIV